MQIKTISSTDERSFDSQVNQAIADGWTINLETYKATSWAHAGNESEMGRHGCYNSIILTKE